MTPLFKKLNLGTTAVVHILNAPDSFELELEALAGLEIKRTTTGQVNFALAFVTTVKEVQGAVNKLTPKAREGATLWMAYPKRTSKKYKCEFNRDSGWCSLGEAGYEPVRQVAIDEDWSALRFRKAEYIKTMVRNPEGAISVNGRRKAAEQRDA